LFKTKADVVDMGDKVDKNEFEETNGTLSELQNFMNGIGKEVSERSERALMKTRILAMNPAK